MTAPFSQGPRSY